jgi:hypothetical protein
MREKRREILTKLQLIGTMIRRSHSSVIYSETSKRRTIERGIHPSVFSRRRRLLRNGNDFFLVKPVDWVNELSCCVPYKNITITNTGLIGTMQTHFYPVTRSNVAEPFHSTNLINCFLNKFYFNLC